MEPKGGGMRAGVVGAGGRRRTPGRNGVFAGFFCTPAPAQAVGRDKLSRITPRAGGANWLSFEAVRVYRVA